MATLKLKTPKNSKNKKEITFIELWHFIMASSINDLKDFNGTLSHASQVYISQYLTAQAIPTGKKLIFA